MKGKKEQGITTNTAMEAEEGGYEWNVWVAVEDIPSPPCSKISNLPTDYPFSALAVVAVLCDNDNGDDNHNDD